MTEVESRLVKLLLRTDPDVDGAVSLFRRERLECEARIRIPECGNLPRFVTCTNWDHCFPGETRETKVRWVFDRRLWSVVTLHLRRDGDAWSKGRPDDVLDVTESLAFANAEALYDVLSWGCSEQTTLPRWAAEAEDPPN